MSRIEKINLEFRLIELQEMELELITELKNNVSKTLRLNSKLNDVCFEIQEIEVKCSLCRVFQQAQYNLSLNHALFYLL
jgi:hypothetical protein